MFAMYCVNGASRLSLLIESMISMVKDLLAHVSYSFFTHIIISSNYYFVKLQTGPTYGYKLKSGLLASPGLKVSQVRVGSPCNALIPTIIICAALQQES